VFLLCGRRRRRGMKEERERREGEGRIRRIKEGG
jgi:hypothetical protein